MNYYKKVQAARSECEGDGASDVEALFASQEEVKPPELDLKKAQAAYSERQDAKAKNGSNKRL
ncbi:hypothetical protein [Bacillus cereus]|uniref:Uncharacterized protein n=1 Tax=Bacillus cereus TaxID=1396 RepID=A0A1S9VA17_BACCE|nr:hypothetical protein [Bacillus cereus]OOR31312.1 hypothetical protein BW892_00355 [Bacillus cereus]